MQTKITLQFSLYKKMKVLVSSCRLKMGSYKRKISQAYKVTLIQEIAQRYRNINELTQTGTR